MQNTIELSSFKQEGQSRIGLKFPYNAELIAAAKNCPAIATAVAKNNFITPIPQA